MITFFLILVFVPRKLSPTKVKEISKTNIEKINIAGDVVAGDKITINNRTIISTGESFEEGTWSPSILYTTNSAKESYAEVISVAEAKYTLNRKTVKVFFDFSVNLKQVPKGSSLTLGGIPFVIDNDNITDFKIYQNGLNHGVELMVSTRCGATWFNLVTLNVEGMQKVYISDVSKELVRFWGYISYETSESITDNTK